MEEKEADQKSPKKNTPLKVKLKNAVIEKMMQLGLWKEELLAEIPTSWDNFGNFVIFNSKFFVNECWTSAGSGLWEVVSRVFSGKCIALQGKIENDDFRSPNTKVILGKSPWVEYVDNGIKYTWNVESTMFCTGNVSERHRIANLDCDSKVVVDMFAGIGYFTLPYLIYAKAKQVIACEWNPVSIEALRLNLAKNKAADKCSIFEGDVRLVCPRGIADHVNLGLIPSCEKYWITAAEILKPSGGILHVHSNVTSFPKSQDCVVQCEKCSFLLNVLSVNISNISNERPSSFKMEINSKNSIQAEYLKDKRNVIWKTREWFIWAIHASHSFCGHLFEITNTKWTVTPVFIHKVKSYAPHIDHLVLDLLCENQLS